MPTSMYTLYKLYKMYAENKCALCTFYSVHAISLLLAF